MQSFFLLQCIKLAAVYKARNNSLNSITLKIHVGLPNNIIRSSVDSARNPGVIFDKKSVLCSSYLFVSKSCLYNIRYLRRIRNTIDQSTGCTIFTSLIHSKMDLCNSLLLNIYLKLMSYMALVAASCLG